MQPLFFRFGIYRSEILCCSVKCKHARLRQECKRQLAETETLPVALKPKSAKGDAQCTPSAKTPGSKSTSAEAAQCCTKGIVTSSQRPSWCRSCGRWCRYTAPMYCHSSASPKFQSKHEDIRADQSHAALSVVWDLF